MKQILAQCGHVGHLLGGRDPPPAVRSPCRSRQLSCLRGWRGVRPGIRVYVSTGKLRIAKGVPNAGQTAWSWSTVHTQSNSSEGGEGQVDYTRWEEDRVLSAYGQELPTTVLNYGSGTPFNGMPSSLHVIDYHVSSKAVLPQPLHEAQPPSGT